MSEDNLTIIIKLFEHIKSIDNELKSLKDRVAKLESPVKNQSVTAHSSDTNSTYHTTTFNKYKFDYSQYRFNGETYGKNRLVLAVVKKYCDDHPSVSAEELMIAFSKNLQGSLGVVQRLDDIKITCKDYVRRFFVKPNEIIYTTTAECVVCTQWGIGNINNFIERAKKLGYNIEKVNQEV